MFFKKSERRNGKQGGLLSPASSNNFFSKLKQSHTFKRWRNLFASFFVVVAGIAGSVSAFESTYFEKTYPGVAVGGHALGGKTREETMVILENIAREILERGVTFTFENKTVVLPLVSDEEKKVIFDIPELVNRLFAFGRSGDAIRNFEKKVWMLVNAPNLFPNFYTDEAAFKTELQKQFSEFVTPAENARYQFDPNGNIQGIFPGRSGMNFDYAEIMDDLNKQLAKFEPLRPISLFLITEEPEITAADLERQKNAAEALLAKTPLTFVFENKAWEITKPMLASWLSYEKKNNDGEFSLAEKQFLDFLASIKNEVESEPRDATFEMADGKITAFVPDTKGKKINTEETYKRLLETVSNEVPNKNIELVVDVKLPERTLAETNTLGIKEMVGQGTTNFRGSPPNRRKNIARGAALLQWKLIAPDEEFSLLNALAPFTLENGYFSELVIKGNKTTPEVGGGLCQIGTTMFRLILNAGLPVLERRNHSYRVSYYEPPVGMDATIYDPSPDFKFKNDTGATLLLTTNINGDDLIFTFWGTKDGRTVKTSDPVVYDVTAPPTEKRIETLDLKPGQIKCTELAHAGAKAYFTYTVHYPNGNTIEETFHSIYRPWQKVCLVGVEKLSEPPPTESVTGNPETPPAPPIETPAIE